VSRAFPHNPPPTRLSSVRPYLLCNAVASEPDQTTVGYARTSPDPPYTTRCYDRVTDSALWEIVPRASSVPPLRVLARLRRSAAQQSPEVQRDVWYHVETLLADLPDGDGATLPYAAAMACALDGLTIACERAGSAPAGPSAVTIYALACDALGVRSVFELLEATDPLTKAPHLQASVFLRTAIALSSIGSRATCLRVLLLTALLDRGMPLRRPLRSLMLRRHVLVPPEYVPVLWRFTFDDPGARSFLTGRSGSDSLCPPQPPRHSIRHDPSPPPAQR
jgi:hypothetical protein